MKDLGNCQCTELPSCTATPTQEDLRCDNCRRPGCRTWGSERPQEHHRLEWLTAWHTPGEFTLL